MSELSENKWKTRTYPLHLPTCRYKPGLLGTFRTNKTKCKQKYALGTNVKCYQTTVNK